MHRPRHIKYGAIFVALGLCLAAIGVRLIDRLVSLLPLSAGFAFVALGASYFYGWPGLLGKTRRGTLIPSSWFLLWPYHLFNYLTLIGYRLLAREAPVHEIVPGLFLGGRLLPWERSLLP